MVTSVIDEIAAFRDMPFSLAQTYWKNACRAVPYVSELRLRS